MRERRGLDRENPAPVQRSAGPAARTPAPEDALLGLQCTIGNAAVARMIAGDKRHTGAVIQRAPDRQRIGAGLDDLRRNAPNMVNPPAGAQDALETVFPRQDGEFQQFPDPAGHDFRAGFNRARGAVNLGGDRNDYRTAPWVGAINPAGNDQADAPDPEFIRNCVDASRAFLASWFGTPKTAHGVDSNAPDGVEPDFKARTEQWLDSGFESSKELFTPIKFADIERALSDHGHGSIAIISFQPVRSGSAGGSVGHVMNAVNHHDTIYWVDAQKNRISKRPLYTPQPGMMVIVLNKNFEQERFRPQPTSSTTP